MKSETAGWTMLPLPGFGSRRLRWATLDEQNETINNSAVFIVLGLILVLIGVLVDSASLPRLRGLTSRTPPPSKLS